MNSSPLPEKRAPMPSKFKVGDIVDFQPGVISSDIAFYLSTGPYKISRKDGRFWVIKGFRNPIGPRGLDYCLVLDHEIQHNAFLNAVTKAVEHG